MELGKIVDVIETAPPVREIPAEMYADAPDDVVESITAGGDATPVTATAD